MNKIELPVYLASKSPRRRKLLKQINIRFKILDVHFNELFSDNETPKENARRIAFDKAQTALKQNKKGIIITADTIVVVDGTKIGKPSSKKDAVRILGMLSGKTHTVYTGFCVINSVNMKKIVGVEKTLVTFRVISLNEIEKYVESGSPMDKAGAYGIQDDYGAVFVSKINGCYYNVVGLPISRIFTSISKVR